jgi:23S rRNA (adenine2030-N6)-methyltransferase
MNYRHAFHAGNAADCVKHALLVVLARAMLAKPKPLFVLDTHAGIGSYDLTGPEAARTGEARGGIARLRQNPPAALADFVALSGTAETYNGSPALIRAMLRPDDRLALCELHKEDAATLRRQFRGDRQVQVHERDGYEALTALLPPPERRGLILIDPPFERPDEFAALAAALGAASRKFRAGVFAIWYPVKHRAPVRDFFDAIATLGIRDVITCEVLFRPPLDPARLNGCGVLVVNPPYGFGEAAIPVLDALRGSLAETDGSAGITVLADE